MDDAIKTERERKRVKDDLIFDSQTNNLEEETDKARHRCGGFIRSSSLFDGLC